MNPSRWIYLVSILILFFPIVLDEWIIGQKKLRRYWPIIFTLVAAGLVYGITESLALHWRVWSFDPSRNFEVYVFGSHLETYLMNILAFPAIGAATLLLVGLRRKIGFRALAKRKL